MTTIAIASGLQTLDHSTDLRAFPDYARYPGSIWYQALAEEAAKRELTVLGADAVLSRVSQGQLDPRTVVLVQERESRSGEALLRLGARGGALTCLESPMYASKFYRNLPLVSASFHAAFLFEPFVDTSRATVTEIICFPRVPLTHEHPASSPRTGFAVIASFRSTPLQGLSARGCVRLALDAVQSGAVRHGVRNHLLDVRAKVIALTASIDQVHVYGRNWPAPPAIAPRHPKHITVAGPCDNKIETLRRHRFNICLENAAIPGYVTEKFADAVEAGCVPVYAARNLASGDTSLYPPFVDADELISTEAPRQLLDRVATKFDEWLAQPHASQRFLDLFSYTILARRVMLSIEPCFKSK